ncbi:hypothetical protein NQ315_017029 [Exocentrus adspersus]|uniref:YqaJ viral recombinase domain-containing protein n=1 Tax=Exocentrus adspersus TaxID=1586481 RepID=A0AAV8V4Z2_9CUCU|nr:hypothetical protein NQ315_017029 [Exocentrus adspersus]
MTSKDFVKATSNNLPRVNMFMIICFVKNDDRFNAAEFRGVKASTSSREEYGDSAVGYVELKREGTVCILQCKVCPEHKVRTKNYSVRLIIDEQEERIVDVSCGCKHALSFVMWVHRRSEEPSPTDVTSYWVKPRLAKIGTSLKFIAASDFSEDFNFSNPRPSTSGDTLTPAAPQSTFKEDLLNVAAANQLEGQIMKHSSTCNEQYVALSVFKQIFKFNREGGTTADNFIEFFSSQMTSNLCKFVEKETRGQSTSALWYEMRFGRITASKIYEFSHCQTPDGTLVETIIGAYKVRDTKYMERGRMLEKRVLRCIENQISNKLHDCGLFVMPGFPVFGASPDAICADLVVEVKCPSSEKQINMYIRDGVIANKYKAQIHIQMLCTNKRRGLFCVADPKFEETENITLL